MWPRFVIFLLTYLVTAVPSAVYGVLHIGNVSAAGATQPTPLPTELRGVNHAKPELRRANHAKPELRGVNYANLSCGV